MKSLDMILTENRVASSVAAYLRHAAACSVFFERFATKPNGFVTDLLDNLYKRYKTQDVEQLFFNEIFLSEQDFFQKIRRIRQILIAHLIVRDLNGLADLAEVVETTSALAEVALKFAVNFYHAQFKAVYGAPRNHFGAEQFLIVIGMGKLGGVELNVSSDIDLIFAYEDEGNTDGLQSISNQEFFTKLGKKIIAALDEVTADGFVFRVDMRLRPFGSEGALVCNLDALEDYYQQYGREWERYAWIKGRVICGPNQALEKLMKPFVFRKYLDFNAYAAMRDLKTQIQRDVIQRKLANNIKLGRGGIREIEFIAQVFQLIRGGQMPSLQIKPTLQVLDCLAEKKLLPNKDVDELKESYIYLRNLEHRLMYIDDQQTQDLPTSEESKQRLLKMLQLSDWASFLAQLNHHLDRVQRYFDGVFKEDKKEEATTESILWLGALQDNEAVEKLALLGFAHPQDMWRILQSTKQSQKIQQLPEPSRRRFDQLMPLLIQKSAELETAQNKDQALIRTLDLLEKVCRRASYLALLTEFPNALTLLVKLCAASPWLAQYLSAHPILLDELLNEQVLLERLDFSQLKNELQQKMQQLQGDVEAQMDAMRHFKNAIVLKVAVQDLIMALSLEEVSNDLSQLAQMVLQVSLEIVWQNFAQKHREIPKFAVIAYGKLGGRERGYFSDLDIIFLYEDAHEQAQEIYAKFAQRLNYWMNTHTNAGMLYETDLQLRPDGNSGLLVSSVAAFEEYQSHKAWVWEHQAITRARFVAGDEKIGAAFEKIRLNVLMQTRDQEKLRKEIASMRARMREAHKAKAGQLDVKQGLGGMIDIEFIVQFFVLSYAQQYPQVTENIGNIALLKRFAELKLMSEETATLLIDAYLDYRKIIHRSKLQAVEAVVMLADKDHAMTLQHAHAVAGVWQTFMQM
jgi:glutamate-ammonia-ligase adenylyltransferase